MGLWLHVGGVPGQGQDRNHGEAEPAHAEELFRL